MDGKFQRKGILIYKNIFAKQKERKNFSINTWECRPEGEF